jgi:hypothetical protein
MNVMKTTGVLLAAMLLLAAATAGAQQASAQTMRGQSASSGQLPVALQRQLEADVARLGDPDCGANCKPKPGSRLVAPGGGGGGLGYVCNDGSCACAGACDCQTMGTICAPKTLGCSDYGCTCAEAEGAEHPESGACN